MLQEQSRLPVDEEDLLHLIDEGVEQDHFGERFARPVCLEPPFQALDRDTVLQGFVQRLDHPVDCLEDGLPNRRAHYRRDRVHEWPRVSLDRDLDCILDGGRKDLGELLVPRVPQDDRFGQNATDLLCPDLLRLETALKLGDLALLRAQ